MPNGGAQGATLERMSAVSLTWMVRETISSSDHSACGRDVDT
jgi:hypothetical protein